MLDNLIIYDERNSICDNTFAFFGASRNKEAKSKDLRGIQYAN